MLSNAVLSWPKPSARRTVRRNYERSPYSKICGKGTLQALKIRDALLAKGFKFVTESPTNQQFVIMTPAQFEKLSEEFALSHIAYLEDGNYSVRICTSWATKDEEVDRLIAMINEL